MNTTYIAFHETTIEITQQHNVHVLSSFVYENINGNYVIGREGEEMSAIWPSRQHGSFFSFLERPLLPIKIKELIRKVIEYCLTETKEKLVFVFPDRLLHRFRSEIEESISFFCEQYELMSFGLLYLNHFVSCHVGHTYQIHVYLKEKISELVLSINDEQSVKVIKEVYFENIIEQLWIENMIQKLCREENIPLEKLNLFILSDQKSKWDLSSSFLNCNKVVVPELNDVFINNLKFTDHYSIVEGDIYLQGICLQLVNEMKTRKYKKLFKQLIASFSFFNTDQKNVIFDSLREFLKNEEELQDDTLYILRNLFLHKFKPTEKIGVVSPFTYGKSTFINGMLGYPILKEAITAETAAVTHISYASHFSLYCEFENEVAAERFDDFQDFKEAVSNYTSVNKVPSSFQRIHITLPFEGLYESVEWIDTPGLFGHHGHHDEITEKVLIEFDSIIFLLDPEKIGNSPYTEKLDLYKRQLLCPFTLVITKYDLYCQSMDTVVTEAEKLYSAYCDNRPIFYASAYWALKIKAYRKNLITLDDIKRDRDIFLMDKESYVAGSLLEEQHFSAILQKSNMTYIEHELNKIVRQVKRNKEVSI